MLKGKTIVLGVTGSIAAYKSAGLTSMLIKLHANVHVIMTQNATNFIHPTVFESLTGNKCLVDTFDRNFQFNIAHISLAEQADLCIIAPASANIIAKMACGIADDMLSTTVLAMTCPVLVSPAMNTHMYENPIVQDNLAKLAHYGKKIIEPDSGRLACGSTGAGKMPPEETLVEHILKEIACDKDMKGIRLLVTAGATKEAIDPVRFISNHSTGRMGYAIARRAMLRGADVTLISASASVTPPLFVKKIDVCSAEDMFEAVKHSFPTQDICVKAAAVADYTPRTTAQDKIKKEDGALNIPLKRTTDILEWLGRNRSQGQVICGFSMETSNVIDNSRRKLIKKNVDLIAANSLKEEGAGFGTDTNHIVMIERDNITDLPMMSKEEAADELLTRLMEIHHARRKTERAAS